MVLSAVKPVYLRRLRIDWYNYNIIFNNFYLIILEEIMKLYFVFDDIREIKGAYIEEENARKHGKYLKSIGLEYLIIKDDVLTDIGRPNEKIIIEK